MIRTVRGIVDRYTLVGSKPMLSKEDIIRREEKILQNAKDGVYDKIDDYASYVRYMEDVFKYRRENIVLSEKNKQLVTGYSVSVPGRYPHSIADSEFSEDEDGKVIDVICPAGMVMSIQSVHGNLPDTLGIKLFGNDDIEVLRNTKIDILKVNGLGGIFPICRVMYVDISSLKPYMFVDDIILYGQEGLRISVSNLDLFLKEGGSVDSKKTRLTMSVDIWSKDETL